MKHIKITVEIEGNEVSRNYNSILPDDYSEEVWGGRIIDMLQTLEKSNDPIR